MANIQTIFVTEDGYAGNSELVGFISAMPDGRVIDFYTSNLEELGVIAKYRVLPVPTIIMLHNSRVVARLVRPSKSVIVQEILHSILSNLK